MIALPPWTARLSKPARPGGVGDGAVLGREGAKRAPITCYLLPVACCLLLVSPLPTLDARSITSRADAATGSGRPRPRPASATHISPRCFFVARAPTAID